MTRGEAVNLLRWYRRDIPKFNYGKMGILRTDGDFLCTMWGINAIDEMIRRIRAFEDDPIETIQRFYDEMDQVLSESDDDHFITHRFASIMENTAKIILNELREREATDSDEDQLERDD